MKYENYSYRTPPRALVFWFFALFPIVQVAITIRSILVDKYSLNDFLPNIIGAIVMLILSWLIATIVVNVYPDVRLTMDGLEINFYFPLLRRWIQIPWMEVEIVKTLDSPFSKILRSERLKNIVVVSKKLPLFYLIPGILFTNKINRVFVINSGIIGYDDFKQYLLGKNLLR